MNPEELKETTTAVVIGVSAKTVSGFTLAGAATVRCRVNLVV
jgi:vacuolar-type H+-ATPase subunit F/Vma7